MINERRSKKVSSLYTTHGPPNNGARFNFEIEQIKKGIILKEK
jgi:hypothetical protein